MKPDSTAEFEFPPGSYWQDRLKENRNKIYLKSQVKWGFIMSYLLYSEAESEGMVRTLMASWRGTVGRVRKAAGKRQEVSFGQED